MRLFQAMLLAISILLGGHAQALTPAQVKSGYYGCVKFLKLKPLQQAMIARKIGISLDQDLHACHLLARQGLARDLYLERVYQRCKNGGCEDSQPSGGSDDDAQSCVSSMQCSGSDHNCLNGTCQEVNGANHCDSGGLSCTSGETCVDGYCK